MVSILADYPDAITETYTGSAATGFSASEDYTVVYTDSDGTVVESPTEVGTYTATCTLVDGAYWSDGSQEPYSTTLTIEPVTLTATPQGAVAYPGQTPDDIEVGIEYSGWITDEEGNETEGVDSIEGFEAPTPTFYETVTTTTTDSETGETETVTSDATAMTSEDTFKESTETTEYSYTIGLSGGYAGSHYEFSYETAPLTVGEYEPIAVPADVTETYDGEGHEISSSESYTIVAYYDSEGVQLEGVPVDAGSYTAVATLENGYCWSSGTDTLGDYTANVTVEKKTLTATVTGEITITYGDELDTDCYTVRYSGFVGDEWYEDDSYYGKEQAAGFEAPTIASEGETVGTWDVVLSGGSADNYVFEYESSATVEIEKLLVDKPTLEDITYDGVSTVSIYTTTTDYYNLYVSNAVMVASVNVGTYTLQINVRDKTNYAWSDGTTDSYSVEVSILPAELTATVSDQAIETGDTFDETDVTVKGFVNDETADTASGYSAPYVYVVGEDGEPDGDEDGSGLSSGIYELTASDGLASNYTFTYVSGTLTVTSPAASESETSGLTASVEEASEELSSVSVSTAGDGSDVAEGTAWATAAQYAAIQDAIAAAEAVLADSGATQEDVEAALAALEEALAAVEGQTGTLVYTVDTESADYEAGYAAGETAATEAANDATSEASAYSVGYAAGAASASASTSASLKTQTLTVTTKAKTVKAKKAKKKAVKVKKAVTVKGAKGKVAYKKAGGNKKLSITKKGVIKVKKGTKKGTYKIKVKVSAAKTASYNAAATVVTVTVKVK